MMLFNIHINIYLLITLGIIAGMPIYFLMFKGIRWLLNAVFNLDVIDDPIDDCPNFNDHAAAIIKTCCHVLWPIYLAIFVAFVIVAAVVIMVLVIMKNLAEIWLKIIKFCWK